ncbi:hydroxymethylglutaryl-CoA synthase [Nocardia sp. NPDC005825]|uniref:hydroxymethylglutaryl-CoA synthase n=1 Tax=unclassified Nocardia TaxID=2637762 RepID=UPI0033E4812F
MFTVGIHDLSFATGNYVLAHTVLADHSGVDVGKFHIGIGQEQMSVTAPDEDIVTMAASAAEPIVAEHGTVGLRTVVLATESSIDQSKSAGVYVHDLLGLPTATRVVELKQACYGATAALQFALGLVCRNPSERVLVIASDVAKYDLDTSAEATQGGAAVAMLITAEPALVRLDHPSGVFTADIMDFWRPNYRATPIVDGKSSITAYLEAVEGAWKDYSVQGGRPASDFAAFCYHQPFTKMAIKAHRHLAECAGLETSDASLLAAVGDTLRYNRLIGNSYTASLYLALASLLDGDRDLSGAAVAFLSYGSGSVAEFFSGTVVPGYRDRLRTAANHAVIEQREPVEYQRYRELHEYALPTDGSERMLARTTRGRYRLAGVADHKRIYERH